MRRTCENVAIAVALQQFSTKRRPHGAASLVNLGKAPGSFTAAGSAGVQVQPLGGRVMVVLHPILVAADLPIQLVHQLVDRGVEVFMRVLAEDFPSLHMQRHFRALASILLLLLLHGQQDVDVHDLVKVADHPAELFSTYSRRACVTSRWWPLMVRFIKPPFTRAWSETNEGRWAEQRAEVSKGGWARK
ncbi:hypothetical protein Ddc_23764 [Ditylenchus destructor]|nr:hypothetical protein Ddc_23764 [Ditylenchus destructor]